MSKAAVLALDVGGKRIGLAIASLEARLPRPLTTLDAANFQARLKEIIEAEHIETLVVGYPRGLDGQSTPQTGEIEAFAEGLKSFGLPVHFQDESVTSKQAEAELESRGKPYEKADIDALAAAYILEDWLTEQQRRLKK